MKALNWGYIIGVVVVIPLLIPLVNFLFFRGNNITPELLNNYISQCQTVSFTVPPLKKLDLKSKVYYPRLKRRGDGTRVFTKFIFFSSRYQKYFAVIDIEFSRHDAGSISVRRKILASGATFAALVHPWFINNPAYGTHDNPVPVFTKELLARKGRSDWSDFHQWQKLFLVSEEDTRAYISEYLEHFVKKEEFKSIFALE